MTTIAWNQFTLPASGPGPRPYVLVTPNGGTGTGNDGGDFGSKTSGTTTNGIQEALNQISSTGGTVYITGGTYHLTSGVVNTGSNQVVVCEAGVTLDFTGATPLRCDAFGTGFSAWVSVASSFNASNKGNWSHNAWYGNGCSITGLPDVSGKNPTMTPAVFCLFQFGQFDGYDASAAGEDFVIDGFVMLDMPVMQRAWFVGVDQYTSIPLTSAGLQQKIRGIKFSRIKAAWGSSAAANINMYACEMNFLHGAWHDVLIEDCSMDASLQPTSINDCGTLFAHANAGDGENLVVRRSLFKGIGAYEVVELQGQNAGSSNNPHVLRTTQNIYLEDCTIDAGSTSHVQNPIALYIDDTLQNSVYGIVNNIEFRRCTFIDCGATFISVNTAFGYVRFVDCYDGSSGPGGVQSFPTVAGALNGRFPMNLGSGLTNFTPVPVGVSPWVYVNNDGVDEVLSIWGGGSVSVSTQGSVALGGQGTYRLRPGDSLEVSYLLIAPHAAKFPV